MDKDWVKIYEVTKKILADAVVDASAVLEEQDLLPDTTETIAILAKELYRTRFQILLLDAQQKQIKTPWSF